MLRQWTSSSSSSQLSLIIFSVVVWVAGTSSVQHDVNNDDSTASSSTTLPLHDSPASADDPVQSSPLQSLIVLLGPSESPETIQNPLNPSEELLDPLGSKVSTENPLRTAINASVDSSASLQVIQDPIPSSEVAEDPPEATDVLRDLRGTKRGSQDPSGSLGGPENPRETPETPLDVPLTQAAPTSAEQPDDDPPPPPGSSHFIREARQTTRSLSDVLRSSEGVQDDQGFPHPTKESPGGPEVSLGTPSLKDDRLETQPDSPEPSHARRDEAKLSLWEIISSSGLADDVTTSSKSHPDDVELAESISEAFNSSEDMREEFKPVDSIQDVLKALESIKHNLRSAESIQDALSIPGAIQKRLRSSSGTSPAALTKSASIRISHNQLPRGSIMLQDAERHAIIDADLLRALSLEVKDELRARTAESDGPAFRRFTGIGRPRALLPPGQKRRRRISRRYNRTRPLASSNPNVYAREGGSMTFDARRRYRKRPADDNSEDKVTPRDYEATQEVVEPVTLLDPTTSARAGYKPDLTMRKYTTDVEDMREAVGLNSYEIRKEERGEESTDPQAGGSSVGDFESRSKTRGYVPKSTSRPGDHNRNESRIHMPENQENTAVYDVEAEHNSRYTLPSQQEAHLPGHPTPPGGHGEHEVTSGGRGLRRDESQASSDYPQATHTITQPPGSHPMTVPEAPSFYISPTPPVVTRRIPAKPVQEYPTYGAVPPTSFTCDDKLTGYYADPEAYCQVFHMCHYEGQQHSFLCPNGTLFNQQLLTCDHWRNVNCHKATSHYVVNKKLYRLQKKDQYSNKSKRQTSQIRQDQANTVTPSSYWRPEMMSFPYRPIIDSYVTIPSPHSTSSRVNSPYSAPITDSYVTTPSLHTVSSLANTPYGTPTKVSYVTAPQSYKAVVALG